KPFVWTKSADEILASIARFAQRTADARAAQQISRTMVTGH
ncbi:MAG: IS630 family transposase, partial [Acidobacteria bacterium]|nr:IS630 family transposase [Acidobacteriota bacterium]NOT26091.1 IS630 family transposase [Acidobacteriota bacterium]NOT28013.1 IS630 family transposase [Acidobacteriota bacterium]